MSYTIYIDECGHSGAGEDDAQPTFVLAGVWISRTQETTLRAEVESLRQKRQVQMRNLKGSELIARPRGQVFLRDLFQLLMNRNVLLTPVAVHKLYMASAILVEDATDYVYNAHFSVRWISDRDRKHVLADYIFDVTPPELLAQFIELRRGDDPARFAAKAREIVVNAASAASAEPFGAVIRQNGGYQLCGGRD